MVLGRGRWVFAPPVIVLGLALSACEAGDRYSSDSGTTTEAGASSMNAMRVAVSETEFAINLPGSPLSPGTYPQGTYTFAVENAGAVPHDLVIKGPGIDSERTARIDGGRSGELTVELQPGAYEMWCSVGDHQERGMRTEITVG